MNPFQQLAAAAADKTEEAVEAVEVEARRAAQWFYGPGGQRRIFQPEDEVPEDWADHPSKVVEPETPAHDL